MRAALTGVDRQWFAPDIYVAAEPIESAVCEGSASQVGNAGLVYQELSRSTRGLRVPVSPSAALGLRFAALAADVTLRRFRACRLGLSVSGTRAAR